MAPVNHGMQMPRSVSCSRVLPRRAGPIFQASKASFSRRSCGPMPHFSSPRQQHARHQQRSPRRLSPRAAKLQRPALLSFASPLTYSGYTGRYGRARARADSSGERAKFQGGHRPAAALSRASSGLSILRSRGRPSLLSLAIFPCRCAAGSSGRASFLFLARGDAFAARIDRDAPRDFDFTGWGRCGCTGGVIDIVDGILVDRDTAGRMI